MSVYALKSDATTGNPLDPIDRELIRLTQSGLPLVSKPFHLLAEQIGLTSDEVKARFRKMLDTGIIRRIAAVPNHYRLGFTANGMTVWNVDDFHVKALGNKIGKLAFVSHCYERPRHLPDWRYNLFAMVHGKNRDDIQHHIEHIRKILSIHCQESDVLYSSRILKKTGLRLRSE